MEFVDFPSGQMTEGPPGDYITSLDYRAMIAYCGERGIAMSDLSEEEIARFTVGGFSVANEPADKGEED